MTRALPPALLLALALLSGGRAAAEIPRDQLARIGVHVPAGAREPLGLRFIDQDGRPGTLGGALAGAPTVLLFEDFRCRTLCGPALSIVASGLQSSGLAPGRDFRLVSLGLNPREGPADARRLRAARLGADPKLEQASGFLSGDQAAISAAARAVGYGYAYDPATDQFTHPVTAFILARDGRVTGVLAETALTGADLRTAIDAAGRDEVGQLVDRLALLCHDVLPLTGRYDGAVQGGLRTAGVATLLAMAAGLAMLVRRGRSA